jgi:hypothetical protein
MDIFNVITAIATTATAIAGIAATVITYRQLLDKKPVLRAAVGDIPNSNRRDCPEREKLQEEGFYILRLYLEAAPQNWDVLAVSINGAKIPNEITSKSGHWLANRLPDKHQITLCQGKVQTHNWKIIQGDTNSYWDFLIKPDDSEKGLLTMTLYGHLWSRVKVPFSYQKTHFW